MVHQQTEAYDQFAVAPTEKEQDALQGQAANLLAHPNEFTSVQPHTAINLPYIALDHFAPNFAPSDENNAQHYKALDQLGQNLAANGNVGDLPYLALDHLTPNYAPSLNATELPHSAVDHPLSNFAQSAEAQTYYELPPLNVANDAGIPSYATTAEPISASNITATVTDAAAQYAAEHPKEDGGLFGVVGDLVGGGAKHIADDPLGFIKTVGLGIAAGVVITAALASAPAWVPIVGGAALVAGGGVVLAGHAPEWLHDGEIVWNSSKYSAAEVEQSHKDLQDLGGGIADLLGGIVGGGWAAGLLKKTAEKAAVEGAEAALKTAVGEGMITGRAGDAVKTAQARMGAIVSTTEDLATTITKVTNKQQAMTLGQEAALTRPRSGYEFYIAQKLDKFQKGVADAFEKGMKKVPVQQRPTRAFSVAQVDDTVRNGDDLIAAMQNGSTGSLLTADELALATLRNEKEMFNYATRRLELEPNSNLAATIEKSVMKDAVSPGTEEAWLRTIQALNSAPLRNTTRGILDAVGSAKTADEMLAAVSKYPQHLRDLEVFAKIGPLDETASKQLSDALGAFKQSPEFAEWVKANKAAIHKEAWERPLRGHELQLSIESRAAASLFKDPLTYALTRIAHPSEMKEIVEMAVKSQNPMMELTKIWTAVQRDIVMPGTNNHWLSAIEQAKPGISQTLKQLYA